MDTAPQARTMLEWRLESSASNRMRERAAVRAVQRKTVQDTQHVNAILAEMNTNVYHDSVPLDRVNDALRAEGFDELEPMLLCGREGRLHENVGRRRWLSLTWYKMESGRYEVVAYVS